jgi:hypothetical protein
LAVGDRLGVEGEAALRARRPGGRFGMRPGAVLGRDFLGIVTGGALPVRDLAQPGHAGGAIGPGEGAAGVEAAARGRVGGAGRLAVQRDPFAGRAEDRLGDRREQRAGIGMARRLEDLVGGAELDDLAEVHHRDPVAHVPDDGEVMGR